MATAVQLISNGTTYHLHNSTGAAVAGSVLTTVGTTPVVIQWPQPWPFAPQGAPFTGELERSLTLRALGSSHNDLITITRTLYLAINAGGLIRPAILSVQPDSASNPAYFHVYGGDVDLLPATEDVTDSPIEGAVAGTIVLRMRTSPYGGRLTTPETLLSAVSMRVNSNTTPDNVEAFSTGAGDLIYEGSPMNYRINPPGGTGAEGTWYVASILSRTRITPTSGAFSSSTQTFGTSQVDIDSATVSLASLIEDRRLKMRIFVTLSTFPSNAEYRIALEFDNEPVFYTPPIASFDPFDNTETVETLDSGPILVDIPGIASMPTPQMGVQLQHRSTNGSSSAGTVTSADVIFYYDLCAFRPVSGWGAISDQELYIASFTERSNFICYPMNGPRVQIHDGTDSRGWVEVRGQVPRYYSGSSLYLMVSQGTTTTNYAVTATHAPLYRGLRGGG